MDRKCPKSPKIRLRLYLGRIKLSLYQTCWSGLNSFKKACMSFLGRDSSTASKNSSYVEGQRVANIKCYNIIVLKMATLPAWPCS